MATSIRPDVARIAGCAGAVPSLCHPLLASASRRVSCRSGRLLPGRAAGCAHAKEAEPGARSRKRQRAGVEPSPAPSEAGARRAAHRVPAVTAKVPNVNPGKQSGRRNNADPDWRIRVPGVRLRRRAAAAAVFALTALLLIAPSSDGRAEGDPDDGSLVVPLTGLSFELDDLSLPAAPVQVKLPLAVVPAPPSAPPLTVQVTGLQQGTRSVPLDGSGLAAQLDTSQGRVSMLLSVPRPAVQRQATYTVYLLFARGDARQQLLVQLTRPAVALDPPNSIKVERTRCWYSLLGVCSGDGVTSTVQDRTLNNPSQTLASGPLGTSFRTANRDGGAIAASDLPSIPPGGSAALHVDVTKPFPLGLTSGTMTLTGPGLATPVAVPVEIRERYGISLLWFVVFAGAIVGLLSREVLANAQKRAASRGLVLLEASTALEIAKQTKDEVYRRRVREATEAAVLGLSGHPSAEATDNALKTLRESLASADKDFQTTTDEAQSAFAELDQVFSPRWQLPRSVIDVLDARRAQAGTATTTLTAGRSHKALTLATECKEALADDVWTAASTWKAELLAALDIFGPPGAAAPASVSAALDRVRTQAVGLCSGPARPTVPEVLSAVDDVVRVGLPELCGAVKDVARDAVAAAKILGGSALAPDTVDALAQAGTQAAASAAASRQDPASTPALSFAGADTVTLLNALQDTLVDELPPGMRAAQRDLLNQGDLLAAAEVLVAAKPRPEVPALVVETDRIAGANRAERTALVFPVGRSLTVRWNTERLVASPPSATVRTQLDHLVAANRRAALLTRLLQAAVAALVAVALAHSYFAATFVGTGPDIVKLFLWGFSADLGASALLAAARTASGQPAVTVAAAPSAAAGPDAAPEPEPPAAPAAGNTPGAAAAAAPDGN